MDTEWEATFWPIDKEDIRARLAQVGAVRSHEERLMRRYVLHLPGGVRPGNDRVRVRDEGDKVTMTIKKTGDTIEEQKEFEIEIDDLEKGRAFLGHLGCTPMAYQETRRELWIVDGTHTTIDEWPHIEPWVEIEGVSEEVVKAAAEKLGFDWSTAHFATKKQLYARRYGMTVDEAGEIMAHLTFEGTNPFQKGG